MIGLPLILVLILVLTQIITYGILTKRWGTDILKPAKMQASARRIKLTVDSEEEKC